MCRDCFWANRAFVFWVRIADARCLGMTQERVVVPPEATLLCFTGAAGAVAAAVVVVCLFTSVL